MVFPKLITVQEKSQRRKENLKQVTNEDMEFTPLRQEIKKVTLS